MKEPMMRLATSVHSTGSTSSASFRHMPGLQTSKADFLGSRHVSPPGQNGQPLAATTANAAAVDLMRSPYLCSGRDGFDEGVRCSDFTAGGFASSPFDLASRFACH
ncbi:hypothetical protein T01_3019 [Trichinella spiralis]|uniref:Uncharacterized protein n=1 Tax=Trichinella spiralis TaxID=6334 RepID=A0A0V0ZDP7_TRISP|nr:hypothetical protein T01_3019 [Trichinella spiralis]